MHGSTVSSPGRALARPRRLILGSTLALALAVWLVSETPTAVAQDSRPSADVPAAAAPAPVAKSPAGSPGVEIKIGIDADSDSAQEDPAKEGAKATKTDETDPVTGKRTITVTKGGRTITVTGVPADRDFDSFGEFVQTEPTLAVMVIGIVAVVFLAPVLAIALILGYRMRKARMQNETLLKLAEKGVVTPVEAMAAVAAGTAPAQAGSTGAASAAMSPGAPVEYAKELRKRAAWSDLRKGVVMGAIGLGLTLYSLFEDQSPNGLGLVLLFVGIGYVVLWWFEDGQTSPRSGGGTPPGPGPGPGPGAGAGGPF